MNAAALIAKSQKLIKVSQHYCRDRMRSLQKISHKIFFEKYFKTDKKNKELSIIFIYCFINIIVIHFKFITL